MDVFDQYLFDEITKSYARANLSSEDYEELYQRFENLNHVPEVQPYLFAMRYFGWGTKSDPEGVLSELRVLTADERDVSTCGLYYDLLLFENENDSNAARNLKEYEDEGYSDVYLKDRSHLRSVTKKVEPPKEKAKVDQSTNTPEIIRYKRMSFESCGYSGIYFTAGDIDYLAARVYFEPLKTTRKLKVRSQIYDGDNAFSDVFSDEYTLKPGTTNFKTTGWGNKNFYGYSDGIYKWIIELDGDKTYSQEFRIYGGKLTKSGVRVRDVKLFASKSSGALEKDRDNYKSAFEAKSLEHIYFKLFIDEPGSDMTVQIFIKVTCLENNSVFCDKYVLHALNSNTIACWNGVGYSQPGKWNKGLYQYSVRIGDGQKQEGTFTVY